MSVTASRKSASPHKYFYSIFNVYFCLRETNTQRKAENRRDALAVRQWKFDRKNTVSNTVTNTTGSSTRWPDRLNGLDGRHVSVRRSACTVRCNPVCAVCVSSRHARTRHADIRRVCVWPNAVSSMTHEAPPRLQARWMQRLLPVWLKAARAPDIRRIQCVCIIISSFF